MKRTLWRLTAASTGALVALSLNVGAAGALSPGDQHPPVRFPHGPVQTADQFARTDQDADSFAKSEQIIPINANVPVQILSLGHNGGDTKQSNSSSASSAAVNKAGTEQSIDQHQSYPKAHYEVPKHDGWKQHDPKGHGPKDRCPKGDDDKLDHDGKDRGPKHDGGWKDHDQKGHGPEGHAPAPPVQVADQHAWTHQDADSKAKSEQVLPINANVPVQVLSLGTNGGDTWQQNRSSAESNAFNQAWTGQSIDQHQSAPSTGGWDGRDGWKDHDSKGYDGGGYGHAPLGPEGAFQGAGQWAGTDQSARSKAESKQLAPINVNAPIQVLSLGHNGGDTKQSNSSAAESAAVNKAGTEQSVDQSQQSAPSKGGWGNGGGGAFQGASQGASTEQQAQSAAKSEQVLPVNVNAPIQVLSLGSNGGDTKQSNSSAAESAAANKAWTDQSADQQQAAGGQGGAFQGASQGASTDQDASSFAKSEQVLPVNLNIPVQALSLGHNGGDTAQSNSSSASSAAGNQAGTSQGVGQAQGGLLGLTG